MTDSASRLHVALSNDPLDAGELAVLLHSEAAGGHCVFVGTTRNNADGKEVTTLFYEAYEKMAIRQMSRLAEETSIRWPIERCVLIHRLGEVPVGEASIVIGVSAAHRTEAFDACRYLIDEVKTRVPIWKREHFADGSLEWVEGTPPNCT